MDMGHEPRHYYVVAYGKLEWNRKRANRAREMGPKASRVERPQPILRRLACSLQSSPRILPVPDQPCNQCFPPTASCIHWLTLPRAAALAFCQSSQHSASAHRATWSTPSISTILIRPWHGSRCALTFCQNSQRSTAARLAGWSTPGISSLPRSPPLTSARYIMMPPLSQMGSPPSSASTAGASQAVAGAWPKLLQVKSHTEAGGAVPGAAAVPNPREQYQGQQRCQS